MKKNIDKRYFFKLLEGSSLYDYLNTWGLLEKLEVTYFSRGSLFDLEGSNIVFLLYGLLKQYYGETQKLDSPRFIQFIVPDTVFPYDKSPFCPKIKALEPSYIFSLPMIILRPVMEKDNAFRSTLEDLLDMNYGSGFFLSAFLRELELPIKRFELLTEIYGSKVMYLSTREIAQYIGISEARAYHFIYKYLTK